MLIHIVWSKADSASFAILRSQWIGIGFNRRNNTAGFGRNWVKDSHEQANFSNWIRLGRDSKCLHCVELLTSAVEFLGHWWKMQIYLCFCRPNDMNICFWNDNVAGFVCGDNKRQASENFKKRQRQKIWEKNYQMGVRWLKWILIWSIVPSVGLR